MNESLTKSKGSGFLSGNLLKIIGCILMVVDHVGYLFFPKIPLLRMIGRPGFPLFVFTLAEGCFYTKNK